MAEKGTGGKNKIGFENDAIDYAILVVIGLVILSSLLGVDNVQDTPQVLRDGFDKYSDSFLTSLLSWLKLHNVFLKTVSVLISLVSVAGTIFFFLRLRRVQMKEHEKYKPLELEESEAKNRQIQWMIILKHMGSENSAEWKLGIMEADNILDELLEERGYRGENLGERLKFAETKGLKTINDAWEAHKARNKLVHEEATLPLNKRDARKIIDLYEKVFKELGYL